MNKFFLRSALAAVLAFTANCAFGQLTAPYVDLPVPLGAHNPSSVRLPSQDRINQNFRYWQAKSDSARGSQCGTGCNDSGCGESGCGSDCGWNKLSGKSIWANYVGRTGSLTGENLAGEYDTDIKSDGIQVGLDLYSDRCTQFGVMFGYEKEKLSAPGSKEIDVDDYYFGFYAARQFRNGYDIRGFIGYGHQTFKPDRFFEISDLKGNTFESTLEFGRRCYINRRLSYRPVIALDIFNNDVESNTAIFGGSSLTQVFARFGSDLQWTRNRLNLNGGAYYSCQMNGHGRNASWYVPAYDTLDNIHYGTSVITLNAGANYYLNRAQTFSVFANWYGDVYLDNSGEPWQHTFLVGGQYRF